jgi:hypothetical protein
MIRLIKVITGLALVWSLWWWGAGYALRQGITGWFAAQDARGWQSEMRDMSTAGYPLRHITTINSPALADPATGAAWQADWLKLDSPAAWPGRQNLYFAPTPQRLSYFDQTVVIKAADLVARLHLKPGLALALDRMEVTSNTWQITGDDGPVMGADSLKMAVVQAAQPETYQFDIDATGYTPGARLRRFIGSDSSLPATFETLTLDMKVTFDRVWDRKALEQQRPQPVEIDLKLADLRWGALRLMAAGKVTVDKDGIPTGSIVVKAENWREMLAMAQTAGAIPPQAAQAAEKGLKFLASIGGNRNALDVQFNLADGYIALGPIPLGPAPRLILR